MNEKALFSTAYLPPVEYLSALLKHKHPLIETHEHFVKQSERNRCYIYSPNGKQLLVIPLEKRSERTLTKDIRISYNQNWQTLHWRSFEAAYRRSPYFEFYEDDFKPFFENKKNDFLMDYNHALLELMKKLLKLTFEVRFTDKYEKQPDLTDDYRSTKWENENEKTKQYTQVFENKHGFIPNLSCIDLLFNHGPHATEYISQTNMH